MPFRDVAKMLQDSTRNVSSDTQPKIAAVWKSAMCSVSGGPRVQAVVGESHQGYHPGVRVFDGTNPMRESWGPAVPTKEQAVRASQGAAVEALKPREGRGR